MTIYIDSDYKCHTAPGEGLTAVETDAFNGKCRQYIEGYRYVPSGETWTRTDGQTFTGEMITPWKDYNELAMAQLAYMTVQYSKAQSDIAELDSALLDAEYSNLIEE